MAASQTIDPVPERPQVWPLSVDAYRALSQIGLIPEKTELLYGRVFHKMSKSPLHSAVVQRLLRLLQKLIPADCLIRQEQPITGVDSEPEPDLAVIRGREGDFWEAHPRTAELVVEVAVTSHDFDRDKARAYASAGVKEFWLVLVPERRVEVHRIPLDDRYAEMSAVNLNDELVSAVLPKVRLNLREVFER